MTDNDIIKALECSIQGKCPECPYFHSYPCGECRKMQKDVLDLINQQQAEIDRNKNTLSCKVEIDEETMKKFILEKVAEIEIDVKTLKAEAIKEFAKFIIDKADGNSILIGDLPDLVKEMVVKINEI